jgi:hypothetical protein
MLPAMRPRFGFPATAFVVPSFPSVALRSNNFRSSELQIDALIIARFEDVISDNDRSSSSTKALVSPDDAHFAVFHERQYLQRVLLPELCRGMPMGIDLSSLELADLRVWVRRINTHILPFDLDRLRLDLHFLFSPSHLRSALSSSNPFFPLTFDFNSASNSHHACQDLHLHHPGRPLDGSCCCCPHKVSAPRHRP